MIKRESRIKRDRELGERRREKRRRGSNLIHNPFYSSTPTPEDSPPSAPL
jgi:hypothetical protein